MEERSKAGPHTDQSLIYARDGTGDHWNRLFND